MAKFKMLCIAVALGILSLSAEAKLYKWVDDQGETHYGEVVPPEYADRNQVQIDKEGRVVKKKEDAEDIQGKKTPEQQAEIEQRRRDKALLNTYSNEQEIDLARNRNLQQVEALVSSIQIMQKAAQENLDGFNKEASDAQGAGRAIPPSLQADIDAAQAKIVKLKRELSAAQEKAAAVKASFDADKLRYRQLTGAEKQP